MAISADTGFLWLAVSFYDRRIGNPPLTKGIRAKAIPYSDLANTVTLSPSDLPQVQGNRAPELDMSCDLKYNTPNVRLIYHNSGNDPAAGDGKIHAVRIDRAYNGELTWAVDTVVYDTTPRTDGYRITYNPNDLIGGKQQAYATVLTGSDASVAVHVCDLDATNANEEYWDYETQYSTPSMPSELSYRVNGTKIITWTAHQGHYSPVVYSNVGDIEPGLADACLARVFTNPSNKRDLVATWHSWYDYAGDGGKGDDEVVDEGVAVCRELYP